MRGLAFPSNAISDRELSYENGTPNSVEDIPIDPALGGPAIDPVFIAEGALASVAEIKQASRLHHSPLLPEDQFAETRQYSQGPQGDPFAPQPILSYIPIQPEHATRLSKPLKRKRKPRREEECGFCQGNDEKNRDGMPEQMATCDECGRSGHPSCMDLAKIGNIIRTYPWKCTECKNCEICQEKGDDDRILFCDFCDRGWHMDCITPPIQEPPTGSWNCPRCPVEQLVHLLPDGYSSRASSVASSSRMSVQLDEAVSGSKGKAAVVVVSSDDETESEDDVDMTVDIDMVTTTLGRMPMPAKKAERRRGRPPKIVINSTSFESSAPWKRMKHQRLSPPPPLPRVRLRLPTQKAKRRDRDDDDSPKGMFDEILAAEDRDTAKTSIRDMDKQMFDRSRVLAETKLAPPPPPPQSQASEPPEQPHAGPSRPLRSSISHHASTLMSNIDTSISPTPTSPLTNTDPIKPRIRTIRFGDCDIQTWYDAPFPEEYATMPDGRLWICEFCLKYMKSKFGAVRHRLKCKARHPPGDEIYRDSHVSVFEVDGRKNKIYCQNLCLLSKMFLDHKSLFYDVEPFLFYVITEVDEIGARFVGYFSKEKRSPKDYNVSCIMTLPVRQRQGWGNLLIDFSYLLSKKEKRIGSPEKPLSALGAIGYKKYWTFALMRFLHTAPDKPKLEDISHATSMTIEDIYNTLVDLNLISYQPASPPPIRPSPGQTIKYPKGRKNGIARRYPQRTPTGDNNNQETMKRPFVPPKYYEICWNRAQVDEFVQTWEMKGYIKLKPEKLQWSPYIVSRNMKTEAIDTANVHALTTTNGEDTVNGFSPDSAVPESTRSISEDVDEDLPIVSKVRQTRSMSTSPVKQSTHRLLLRSNSSQTVSFGNGGELAANGARSPVDLALDGVVEQTSRVSSEVPVPFRSSPRKRRRYESSTPSEGGGPTTVAAAAAAIFDEPLEEEEEVERINGIQEESARQVEPTDVVGHVTRVNGHSDIKSEDTGTPLTNTAGHGTSDEITVCGGVQESVKSEDGECEEDADGESDSEEEG